MKSLRNLILSQAAAAAIIALMPAPAFAQTGTNSADGNGTDIIVTARKGAESIMRVPAGISVLSRETLETKQVSGLADIGRLVPSLNVFEGVNQAQFGITMRGIPTVQGAEPSVAMVVDGIQTPGLSFFNQDMEGAESVEVLRGPQGALYGRGAIAGVIVINTKQPTNDFEGDARVLIGNGDTQKFSTNISGPIVEDKILFKLSAGYNHFGGLVPNVGYGGKADPSRSVNLRGALVFNAGERTHITVKGDYQRLRATGNDWEVVDRTQLNDYSVFSNYDVKPFEKRWFANGALKVEHEADFGTFLSISQYARTKDVIGGDADFSPANLFLFAQTIDTEALNQDIRFSSPKSDVFNWQIGAFYQWRQNTQPLLVTGAPGGAFDGATLLNSSQFDRSNTYAVYGQAKLTLNTLDFNVALRYDIEKRMQLDRNLPGSEINSTFRALQPQASITNRFSDELSGYVSYGRGFRSGGFNAAADVLVPRPTAPYPVLREYPKELTDNFEVGFKSRLFDRKLLLNVSAYHTIFKDQQYFFFFLLPAPARDIVTIPKSKVNGLEVEANWTVFDGFKLDFGLALTDAKVRDVKFKGNSIANVYKRTFNVGGEYSFDLGEDMKLMLRGDYQRLGPIYYDLQNTYYYKGTDLLNARITLRRGNYEISGFGRNILDSRFPANFLADGVAQDLSLRRRMTPATYGVEFRLRF
jgi:iron complex outermembrane recepter protein